MRTLQSGTRINSHGRTMVYKYADRLSTCISSHGLQNLVLYQLITLNSSGVCGAKRLTMVHQRSNKSGEQAIPGQVTEVYICPLCNCNCNCNCYCNCNCNCNCNCKYDDLYSTVRSKLLLGCFTRLLNIKAKSQISNTKKKSKTKL